MQLYPDKVGGPEAVLVVDDTALPAWRRNKLSRLEKPLTANRGVGDAGLARSAADSRSKIVFCPSGSGAVPSCVMVRSLYGQARLRLVQRLDLRFSSTDSTMAWADVAQFVD
ncbi:MAG: hypothetical protein E5Y88_29045 [Mesorhizobium sp.]|uniref:hypothetical protein n=1 Tax=Mesorhizobium sp. TaxID=1871066 RepID=UPI001211F468|nr:hypothetical protein [Mesorhizobium sp.]TIL22202.1 MAG: hypothetical protein E5Y88_29045 [Mesorhizobium sp.]